MTDKHAPDSLKFQWRLLALVMRAEWATSLDKSVAFEIIDNYYSKFGNSRASLGYLQKATGSGRRHVVASCRRLADQGIVTVVRQGKGTRPTEYQLNFDLVAKTASGSLEDTTSVTTSSGSLEDTQTVLPVTGLQAELLDRMIEPAPPTAPLSAGLSATDAEGAGGGFEELWKAYGHRQKKADAKAAYVKANPDAAQHAHMIEAAKAWFAAWATQGKAEAPRFTLGKWIEREEFECDPPTALKPKERKVKAAPAASNDNEPADDFPDFMKGSPRLWPVGRHEGKFIDGEVAAQGGGDVEVSMTFQRNDGETFHHRFFIESIVRSYAEDGKETLREIMRAVDIATTDDTDELLFKPLVAVADGKTLTYIKAA